jgi:hypothetical protein
VDPFLDDLTHRGQVLIEERDRLVQQLDLINRELGRLSVAAEVYRAYRDTPLTPKASMKKTLSEAIEAFLADKGGFARIPDIYTALLTEGFLNAKNKRSAYNQVYGALQRHAEKFRHVGGGTWALIEMAQEEDRSAEGHPDNGLEADGVLKIEASANLSRPEPSTRQRLREQMWGISRSRPGASG